MALHQIPLAVFTTLVPIGAGAFVILFLSFLRQTFKPKALKILDRYTVVPLIFITVGFLFSFLHLANPLNALNVLRTIGQTPLANEIVAFVIFYLLAIAYWVLAITGRFRKDLRIRTIAAGIVMVAGIICVCFMGSAYMLPSLPVWDAPRSIMELLGIWMFGGSALGLYLTSKAYTREVSSYKDDLFSKILLGVGAFVLIGSAVSIFLTGSSTTSAIIDVEANARSLILLHVTAQIMILTTVICSLIGRGHTARIFFGIATVCSIVASFLLRLCFYGMQIGIGL